MKCYVGFMIENYLSGLGWEKLLSRGHFKKKIVRMRLIIQFEIKY